MMNYSANHGSVRNGSLEQRVNTKLNIDIVDGDQLMDQHMVQMVHFANWGVPMRELRAVLGSRKVKKTLDDNFGKSAKMYLDNFLDDFARGGVDRAKIIKSLDRLRVAFTTSAIRATPVIMLKQLTSVPAYAMDVPLDRFVAGLADFAAHPKKAVQTLLNTRYIKNRYTEGWERDVKLAMKSANPFGIRSVVNWLMLPTKMGDAFAIMAGGWGVYKYHLDEALAKGMTREEAEKIADREFGVASDMTQQAAALKDLAYVQRLGSLGKLFTMFMTTPISYYQQWEGGLRNLVHGRGSVTSNLKRMAIAQFVLPMIFQFVASGLRWDDDDQLRAIVMGPFNGLFIARDILGVILDGLFLGNFFDTASAPPLTDTTALLGKIGVQAHKMITGEGTDFEDVMKFIEDTTSVAGRLTGVPVDPGERIFKGYFDPNADWRQKIGFSQYAAEKGSEYNQAKDRMKKIKAVGHRISELKKANKWNKLADYRKENKKYTRLVETTKIYDKMFQVNKKQLEKAKADGTDQSALLAKRKELAERYLKATESAF